MPTRRREIVRWIINMCKMSVEWTYRIGSFSRGSWYHKSKASDQPGLRMHIRDIAMSRPRFGYEQIHVLLRRKGRHINLKCVHMLYCLEDLQVHMKVRRKKRKSLHGEPTPTLTAPRQCWSADFVNVSWSMDNRSRFQRLSITGVRY